jgi:hypothetical protein
MTRTALALFSALAIGAVTLPAHATDRVGDWEVGGDLGNSSEGVPTPRTNPTLSGGWSSPASGEAGGSFDPSSSTPLYGNGRSAVITGEGGGSFTRATATPLGS